MPRTRPPRRRPIIVVTLLATVASLVAVVVPPTPPVDAAPREILRTDVGPLGGITVFGDSVLLGSALTSPTLADRLVDEGWGPVRMRAGEGYATGRFHRAGHEFAATTWIDRWRSEGWATTNVLINLGANDSGVCTTDLQCSRDAILHLVDHIGPGHRIWWPQITRFPFGWPREHQDTWNLALRQIADERDDFFTWDWPAVMASEGYSSPDGVHLSFDSYRRRSARMAEQFTHDVAMGSRTGRDAALPVALADPAGLVILPPERVADTRGRPTGPLGAGEVLSVDLSDRVPAGTSTVAVNLTATGTAAAGFLTAFACGRQPPESSRWRS